MPKDRVFLLVAGAAALVALGCILSAAAYTGRPAGWASAPPAPATPTQALNLAAQPASVASPTSRVPTLPPEWTAAPFPTRAAPTASSTPPAPLSASAPASPLLSATPPEIDPGPPTSASAASPSAPSSTPASGAPPTSTASPPGVLSPTAPATATAGPPAVPSPTEAPETDEPQPTDTPPPPTSAPGGIGQRVEAGGLSLTVMGVSKQEDSESVYLVLDVVLENVSREQASYELVCFSVVDTGDLLYDAADDAPAPNLLGGDLARGSRVRGNVAFYIGPETHGLTFIFTPLRLSDDSEIIRVSLGQ